MKCFIIALENEARPVLDAMRSVNERRICGKSVYTGTLFEKFVALIICGVGKVNAACGTQIAIDVLNADGIINIGYAGGLNDGVEIGNVYAVSKVVQYDFDLAKLNGTKVGTLNECKDCYLPLTSESKFPLKALGTGDRFNDSKNDFNLLTRKLKADLRDMECGAIAQTCMHAKIKCRAYKVVSDIAESSNTTAQYLENIKLCAATLSERLKDLYEDC